MRKLLVCLCALLLLAYSIGNAAGVLPGDINNDGFVSTAEVQTVINTFVGLPPGTQPAPSVSSVTSSVVTSNTIMYGKEATFTVTGNNLSQGVTACARYNPNDPCTPLTEKPGPTTTSRSYTYVPSKVGPLTVTFSATEGGAILKESTVAVPFPQVTLETIKGSIVVELRPDRAPISVDNFLKYVNDGFYDNTIFHRVVNGPSFYIIQGGGFGTDQVQKNTRAPITLEAPATTGLSNIAGTIGMARSIDANSATSQFFFNGVNNTGFDGIDASSGYAVFGSVIQGMNVVWDIETIPVDSSSKPTAMVTVMSARQTNTLTVALPPAPTGVTATGNANQVSLSWNSVPLATSYYVYWLTTQPVTTATALKYNVTSTAVSLRRLDAFTTYYFLISAVYSAGESIPSSQVAATTSSTDGYALYSTNCATCHGAVASSVKRGRTAAQIQSAITTNKGGMGSLTLTAAEIQAIANVL